MRLTIYPRGKIWHYRGTIDGERLRGSTGHEDKARALEFIASLEDRHWKSRQLGPEAVTTFAQGGDRLSLSRKADPLP